MRHSLWNAETNLLRSAKKLRYLHRKHIRRYRNNDPHVFGIGDSRTGTLSLSYALQILDIPTVHWPRTDQEPDDEWIPWIKNAPYQGFVDHPISDHYFFKDLDNHFPQAKFILTTRKEQPWKESVKQFFSNTPIPSQTSHVNDWYKKRRAHEKAAKEYIPEGKLAVLPVEANNKWERLCTLLNKDVPDKPDPHANKRTSLLNKIKNY